MAFGGVLLLNLLLQFGVFFVLVALFAGIVFLLAGIVFLIRGLRARAKGAPFLKRRVVLVVICAVLGVSCLAVPTAAYLLLKPDDVVIETPQGEEKVPETAVKQFGWALCGDDLERVQELLARYPELIYYTSENMDPLEIALQEGSLEVSNYLQEHYNHK